MAVLKALVGLVLLPPSLTIRIWLPVTPMGMKVPGCSLMANGEAAAPVFASVITCDVEPCQGTVALIVAGGSVTQGCIQRRLRSCVVVPRPVTTMPPALAG